MENSFLITFFQIVDAADYVDTLYSWSALNTDVIGEHIGVGLTHLIELTPLRNIHLIGEFCFKSYVPIENWLRDQ